MKQRKARKTKHSLHSVRKARVYKLIRQHMDEFSKHLKSLVEADFGDLP